MRFQLFCGAAMAAMAIGLIGTTAIASAAPSSSAYTCTGGSIPSGSYARITVTGYCDVEPDAVINVVGNVEVAPGAVFDAQSAPSTITVGHNVTAGSGSILGLGCQWHSAHGPHPCTVEPGKFSVITVHGNVTATDAILVLLNGITVEKNVTLTGGGGPFTEWAEKNDTIGGNLTISDVAPDWLGVEFSTIGGNVNLSNITTPDPDGYGAFGDDSDGFGAVSVVVNTVGRNLNCSGLAPVLSGGFIPGEHNFVGHNTTGQCVGLVGGF
jgi:hypothetical protein